MRILKVIHGYPPDYMAGSEVYSQTLLRELAKQHDVFCFTRVVCEFDKPYRVYEEEKDSVHIYRVNNPENDRVLRDKYFNLEIEKLYERYLLKVKPDIVHIGHICHLSTRIIEITKLHNIPIVFTIHDYWMFCYRGQLFNSDKRLCDGPSATSCAICSSYPVTCKEMGECIQWMKRQIDYVDRFISPSKTLFDFFVRMGVDQDKIVYQKYGFVLSSIQYKPRKFTRTDKIRFGFMGRITPTKGISVLEEAFAGLPDEIVYVYGSVGNQSRFLSERTTNMKFVCGYTSDEVQSKVLDNIDVLIVPSIWYENSPLVIQEAFLAGVPVITSNIGGMKELVDDKKDGFLFEAGNAESLREVIAEISNNPEILNTLDLKGARNKVCSIENDVATIVKVYRALINEA